MPNSILILSPDVISEKMAGPAIRYWEFAKALVHSFPKVTLAIPNALPETLSPPMPSVELIQHHKENIHHLVEQHDIIVFQGYIFDIYPLLRETAKILVADLYDPVPLEALGWYQGQQNDHFFEHITDQVRMMNDQIRYADYFLCASERQRDLWLGHLLALGRINPATYQEMQQRVLVIPFGLPDNPPQRTGKGFRQNDDTSFVLLWGGGIWEWFDPLTLIRAVHRVLPTCPHVKLIFLGTQHPNPTIETMPMQHRAEALARELNVYGKQVIFQPGWVPYDALQNHLLDADVGVSAHLQSLETHFSFRTRLLYYLWAGKPIITTTGDVLAEEIAAASAGIIVNEANEADWEQAIIQLQNPETYATYVTGVQKLAQKYAWSTVTQPLQQLATHAHVAPDMEITTGHRHSTVWHCEKAFHHLRGENEALKQQLFIMEHSNSWRITAPIRNFRRWLSKFK